MEQKKNRKWIWQVGCLSVFAIGAILAGGFFYGIVTFLRNSDVVKQTMSETTANKEIMAYLGAPLEHRGIFMTGSLKTSNGFGKANFKIPVKGSKNEGTILINAQKFPDNPKWTFSYFTFFSKDGSKTIPVSASIQNGTGVNGAF